MGASSSTPSLGREVELDPQHAAAEEHRGLENQIGANNCFLNVVIQALWHLRSFRERFLSLEYTHRHQSQPCLLCALLAIFSNYRFSENRIIPPTEMRAALARMHVADGKFQLFEMDDADEALHAILQWLHSDQIGGALSSSFSSTSPSLSVSAASASSSAIDADVSNSDAVAIAAASADSSLPTAAPPIAVRQASMGDVPCQPRCISHTVFGLAWIDVLTCARCGANADPIPSHSFIYQIYAQDLLAWPVSTFSALLAMLSDSRSFTCPEAEAATACAGKAKLRRHFLPPIGDTLAVSLVWPPEPESTYIEAVLARLGTEIDTSEAFHIHNAADEAVYALRGMIVYYGRHYFSFFFSEELQTWLQFNDGKVTVSGGWDQVCAKLVRGRVQPMILLFETPRAAHMTASRAIAEQMLPHASSSISQISHEAALAQVQHSQAAAAIPDEVSSSSQSKSCIPAAAADTFPAAT